jgi:hypothetical protein
LAHHSKDAQDRAEARSKKDDQRARESAKATKDYKAAGLAVLEKTARLKLLRLAKEATEKDAEIRDQPATPKARSL